MNLVVCLTDHICPEQLKKFEKKRVLRGMMHTVSAVSEAKPNTGQTDVHSGLH